MFNERIVCDGALGSHPLEVKIMMGTKTLTMAADGLVAACHDNVLTISRTDAGADVDVAAQVVIKNVKDEAGNVYSMPDAGQALVDTESTKKADEILRKVNELLAKA